jgi:hypothetical protein
MKKSRMRISKTTVDTSERQSMQRACVLVTYEMIISGPHLPEEDLRVPGVGIFDVKEGKVRCHPYSE